MPFYDFALSLASNPLKLVLFILLLLVVLLMQLFLLLLLQSK